MMVIMPLTGIGMGYYSGKGIPFFGLTVPGRSESVGWLTGYFYKVHTWVGVPFEYLIAFHMSAVGFHMARG